MCEGMKGRFHTNLDDLKRFLLTKRHARGTPGSTGTSSPRCATPKKNKENANKCKHICSFASAEAADFTAVWDGPGPGCLTGVLEGLMVTVQHKNYGSEQLVHPLQAEEEARGRHVARV